MTRYKDATFEGASLTGTNGATSSQGTVTLDATSLMKGTYSAKYDTAAGFSRFDFTASDDIFVSLYIYLTTVGNSIRSIYITNGVRVDIRSNRALRLSDATGTQIGSDSGVLSLNTLYRVGVHWKKATVAANDGQAEAYVTAAGSPDAAFGAAFSSSTTVTQTAQGSRVDVGNTSGATANTWFADNIRIDSVAMPTDDLSAVNTPMTVTRTVSNAITMTKTRNVVSVITQAITSTPTITKLYTGLKTITQAITSTLVFAKGMVSLQTITIAISTTKSVLKNVGKPISRTITSTLSRITTIPHNVLVSITPIVSAQRNVFKIITRSITTDITAIVGKGYYRTAEVIISISSVIQKNILKPIVLTQTVVASIQPKSIAKTITRSITSTVSSVYGNLVLKTVEYIATVSVNRNISVGKIFTYVQDTVIATQRSFTLLISSSVIATGVPEVQKNILFTRTVVMNAVITCGKVLSNTFMTTYLRKNVRALSLELTNTILTAVGKNSRTIDLKDTNES
jgi:hypothetical protein